jgi:prolyl-tRNA editing enzyme YbaK/EbsC (Cys-tRNA(Pro) deacylase)
MCPGHISVSEQKLEKITGHNPRMATPEEVEEHTGYQIGGVSPFDLDVKTYMEKTILDKQKVKPAAGSKVTGVSIKPEDLKKASEADVEDLARK